MTQLPKSKFRGSGRVAFLALEVEIKKKIEEGYPLLVIHRSYAKDLNISYSQFVRYVGKSKRKPINESEGKNTIQASEAKISPPKKRKPGPSYDANRGNDGDDLI